MKGVRVMAAVMVMAACGARAGALYIDGLEADYAKALTGQAQSNMLEQAAAHTNRTDNPHMVTAEQVGAVTTAELADALATIDTTDALRLVNADGTAWIDGTGAVWRVTNYWHFAVPALGYTNIFAYPHPWDLTPPPPQVAFDNFTVDGGEFGLPPTMQLQISAQCSDPFAIWDAITGDYAATSFVMTQEAGDAIGPAYLSLITETNPVDRVAFFRDLDSVAGGVPANAGVATNLTVRGWLALPQTQPTNLVIRLVCSNEVIISQEVYP